MTEQIQKEKNFGRNNASYKGSLKNCHVLGDCTYYPKYQPANGGQPVSQRLQIPIAINNESGQNNFYFTVWGPLAHSFAHIMRAGKGMNFDTRITSSKGNIKDASGNIMMQADGNPMSRWYENHVIDDFTWGHDSSTLIAKQENEALIDLQSGGRGQDWNIPNTPGYNEFKARDNAKRNAPYAGGDTLGFAKIGRVNGTVIFHIPKGEQKVLRLDEAIALAQSAGAMTSATPQNIPATPQTVGNVLNPVRINGFTLQEMLTTGWTIEQLKAISEYKTYFPPAPPSPSTSTQMHTPPLPPSIQPAQQQVGQTVIG